MAIFEEPTALPSDLALAAGFTSVAPDQGVSDAGSIDGGMVVPPQIAAAMGVDAAGNFRVDDPIAKARNAIVFDDYYKRATGRATGMEMAAASGRGRGAATLGYPSAEQIDPTAAAGLGYGQLPTGSKDQAMIDASVAANRVGVPSTTAGPSPNNMDYAPPSDSTEPHPMLSDPKFLSAYASDPKAGAALYHKLTGRNVAQDYALKVAQDKSQDKFAEGVVDKLVKSGLNFDPVTGEPMVHRVVADTGILSTADPTQPPPLREELRPLSTEEKRFVQAKYKSVTGMDLPQGVPTPAGLTGPEAADFRQQFKQSLIDAKLDPKNPRMSDPDYIRVYRDVWGKLHQQQQASAAALSNPAVKNANPAVTQNGPGFLTRMMVKTANAAQNVGYNVARTGQQLIEPLIPAARNYSIAPPNPMKYSDLEGDRVSNQSLTSLMR